MSGPVLYLVRHGISEWNLLKKWQGQVDTNLASEGQEQAKKRGQSFKADGVNFDDAITSDLKRAAHTCQLLMSTCGKTEGSVNPDERLRECGLGEFEGMHKTTIYGEKYAELWSYLGNLSHEQRVRTPYFEGLETPLDVGTRAGQCLLEALMNNEDVTLLAVTHSTVIESLLACLFGADFDSIHTDNLCWIRFRVEQSRLVMDGSEGVHFKVSPDAIPISPSCMSSFQACGFKTLLGGSAGLLISMYLSTHGEAGRSEEVWGFCEGNHRISLHVGEFFSTIGAGLLAVSGLYTALQFNFKLQQGEELQRQRNAQLLALSVAAVGSCLTYAHITLSSEYMHLGEALTLWTLLFAVLSTGKSSDGTEAPRSATLFAFLYTLYWKSGFEPIALYSMIALTLCTYVARMLSLRRKAKDPRTRIAFLQGIVALVGGVLTLSLDPYMCDGFGQVITMRALGYCLLSGSAQLILASFVELSSYRAWLQPSTLFDIWIPSLNTWKDEHITQK